MESTRATPTAWLISRSSPSGAIPTADRSLLLWGFCGPRGSLLSLGVDIAHEDSVGQCMSPVVSRHFNVRRKRRPCYHWHSVRHSENLSTAQTGRLDAESRVESVVGANPAGLYRHRRRWMWRHRQPIRARVSLSGVAKSDTDARHSRDGHS